MNFSIIEIQTASIQDVGVSGDTLVVDLADGRTVSVPLAWYPRLLHGKQTERDNWRLIGGGEGIHWPDLDEDISIENILLGKPSGESQRSLKRWLESRMSLGYPSHILIPEMTERPESPSVAACV